MAESRPVFPLRFHDERLRALLRTVAAQDGISQNELAEQAIEHEVVARGALLAEDLAAAAERLRSLTGARLERLVERTIDEFADGEARPDPLAAYQIPPPDARDDAVGAVAAFRSVRG